MIRYISLFLLYCTTSFIYSNDGYKIKVDLTAKKNDKLKVELIPPDLKEDEILFIFPKVIPGAYCIDNFGRFVDSLRAYDDYNKLLKIEKNDINSYKIFNATALKKRVEISYYVDIERIVK